MPVRAGLRPTTAPPQSQSLGSDRGTLNPTEDVLALLTGKMEGCSVARESGMQIFISNEDVNGRHVKHVNMGEDNA